MTTTTESYRTPGARRVLPAGATRQAWLDARRQGLGASDTSTVLGLNPYQTRMELWLDKTGQVPHQDESNDAMYWGSASEDMMRRRFTEDTGLRVRRSGLLRSRTWDFMQCTPDGLTADAGYLELKTAGDWAAQDWEDGPADHAAIQTQRGLLTTGLDHGYIGVLIKGREWTIHPVAADEDLQALIVAEEERFWHHHVLGNVPPELTADDVDTLKRMYPHAVAESPLDMDDPAATLWDLIRQRDRYKAALKSAEDMVRQVEAAIRLEVGDHDVVRFQGADALKLRNDGTFSSKAFTADHPQVAEALTIMAPTLDMDRLKAEHPDLYTQARARVLRVLKAAPLQTEGN